MPGPFWVYVIELDGTGLGEIGEGAVYVGQTAKTPEERFTTHKAGGIKAAKVVARRGMRLRPDLYPPEGPFETRAEAIALLAAYWEPTPTPRLSGVRRSG